MVKARLQQLYVAVVMSSGLACAADDIDHSAAAAVVPLGIAAATRPTGDAERGRSLLLNNGTEDAPYLSCGIPKSLVDTLQFLGVNPLGNNPTIPERERGNAELPYNFSRAKTRAGVEVVTANCLMC